MIYNIYFVPRTGKMSLIDGRSLLKGASVLIVALAWNEAAKKFIDYMFPKIDGDNEYSTMVATVVYAVFVSIMVILLITAYNYTNVKISSMISKNKEKYGSRNAANSYACAGNYLRDIVKKPGQIYFQ